MHPRWLAAAVAAMFGSSHVAGEQAYTVERLSMRPAVLHFTLTLEPTGDGERRFVPRGAPWGVVDQTETARCDGVPLQRDVQGAWRVPGWCRVLSWRVRALETPPGGADASTQATRVFDRVRQVLISESSAILRSAGSGEAARLSTTDRAVPLLGAVEAAPGEWRIPSARQAPEFFVLGRGPIHEHDAGSVQVRSVADDPRRVERLGLERLHDRVLSFLVRVVGLSTDVKRESLLVVWLGIDARHRRIGGAAGSRSFVANYLIDGDGRTSEADATAASIMTLAHEQFHQLVDIARNERDPWPEWLSESLAQHYALAALRATMPGPVAGQLTARFVDPDRPVAAGLLEWNRRARRGDAKARQVFYQQGATFWQALDRLLESRSANGGLDRLLPRLLLATVPDDGTLPVEFLKALHDAAGRDVDGLLERYVGL